MCAFLWYKLECMAIGMLNKLSKLSMYSYFTEDSMKFGNV